MPTKYACDQICLRSWSQKGLNMLAISNLNRTIYPCNSFQRGPNMLAIIDFLFSRDSNRNHSHVLLGRFSTLQAYLVPIGQDCNHIWHDSKLRLQSDLVPSVAKIANIFGPCHYNYCNYVWSTPIVMTHNLWLTSFPASFVANLFDFKWFRIRFHHSADF